MRLLRKLLEIWLEYLKLSIYELICECRGVAYANIKYKAIRNV